ncbi:Abhydrolase-4 domain-containing protein [Mycena chlorophos]|uniref:Abhydrolase-4 domain-containing protein n=1 Tax=Mycena chlorophos TaxID=658473 RepID=A0A8H6W664_MYCCL|nr:Abhydrolase-4 domain-containing protein [Mycena chlorophos]
MGAPLLPPYPRSERRNGPLVVLLVLAVVCFAWPLRVSPLGTPFLTSFEDNGVKWKPCWQDPEFLCGSIEVPLDYDDPSAGKTPIYLTNLPATAERQGIIITHYGGPGGSGVDASFPTARGIRNVTGGHHDIISFDQRGQGRAEFQANTVFEATFSVPMDPFSEAGRAVLVEQQKQALVLEETQGAVCARTVGAKALGYMSTTSTIYDMQEISRVLDGEDALINFWGGSYGSLVGQYLASMLPHKAGRIYITGNVPADMWANTHYETQETLRLLLDDSEYAVAFRIFYESFPDRHNRKTYAFFLNECFEAGPTHCPLAHSSDTSAESIQDRVDAFLDRLQAQPLMVANATRPGPGYLTSGMVRSMIFLGIQYPALLPQILGYVAHAMDGDGFEVFAGATRGRRAADNAEPDEDGRVYIGQEALCRLAISCGDALPRAEGERVPTAGEIVDEMLVTLRDVSPRFGATMEGAIIGPGRVLGRNGIEDLGMQKTLATPTLVVSNIYDPITPLAAGTIVQTTMGDANAHHLIQDTAGHAYLAPDTACGAEVIRKYFVEGVLPQGRETRCVRDHGNYFVEAAAQNEQEMAMAKGMLGAALVF